jgi:glycosyltransferase involved in cell wall biosynthesis
MLFGGVSIVICCYNSACRLPQTLRHLALQQVDPSIKYEIILVDNASTDNTAETARTEWAKYDRPSIGFTLVYEEKPGLSNARDRGIRTSRYGIIIFCDDDNWLHEHYINIGHKILSGNPNIAALGGQSIAVTDAKLPVWFESSKSNYAVGKQAENSGDITSRKHLWGCGLVIRRDLYLKAFDNFPSILSGRKEGELTSGEDSEMCMRFIMMGYQLYYSEALQLQHYLPENRLNQRYNDKLMEGFISAYQLLSIYAKLIELSSLNFFGKNTLLLKPILRIALSKICGIKRWNLYNDELNIYLTSGFKFSAIPPNIVRIREFSKRSWS